MSNVTPETDTQTLSRALSICFSLSSCCTCRRYLLLSKPSSSLRLAWTCRSLSTRWASCCRCSSWTRRWAINLCWWLYILLPLCVHNNDTGGENTWPETGVMLTLRSWTSSQANVKFASRIYHVWGSSPGFPLSQLKPLTFFNAENFEWTEANVNPRCFWAGL